MYYQVVSAPMTRSNEARSMGKKCDRMPMTVPFEFSRLNHKGKSLIRIICAICVKKQQKEHSPTSLIRRSLFSSIKMTPSKASRKIVRMPISERRDQDGTGNE
jgi:hypothetical protein